MTTPSKDSLTHFDAQEQAWIVDVGGKAATRRKAVAQGSIQITAEAFAALRDPSGARPKGGVLRVARIAGIQGAKQTSLLIPLCLPLPLTHLSVEFILDADQHRVTIETRA